jgi:hypothetical protein
MITILVSALAAMITGVMSVGEWRNKPPSPARPLDHRADGPIAPEAVPARNRVSSLPQPRHKPQPDCLIKPGNQGIIGRHPQLNVRDHGVLAARAAKTP